jgi:hypothetical protein
MSLLQLLVVPGISVRGTEAKPHRSNIVHVILL